MKKLIAVILAAALLLPCVALPGGAASSVWDAKHKAFSLKTGPEILRIETESNENGTRADAFFRHSEDFSTLGDLYQAAMHDADGLFGAQLGIKETYGDDDRIDADLDIQVQLAYSFDGTHWVYDWKTDEDEEDPVYYIETEFDRNDDGFYEFVNMPGKNVDLGDFFDRICVFNGRDGDLTPGYVDADDDQIKAALTKRNNAMLQGKGEFTGKAYVRNDANWDKGFAVDFNKHTLYVKARYRVYSALNLRTEEDWGNWERTVSYSDWGAVKTYNNKTASAEGQDCVPDTAALLTKAAPTLRILATERYTVERDGVKMKATRFWLDVDYPAATAAAMARFYALPHDVREEFTGEYYDPGMIIEIKVGTGGWYHFNTQGFNDSYFEFDDDSYWQRDILEELGYQPGDPVYLRVRLAGDESRANEKEEGDPRERVVQSATPFIWTAASNAVELSLTGKYNIRYELNGGSFPWGTNQIYQFDEDTVMNVDLTSEDYIPEREHFTFKGWYTTEDFAKGTGIKAFDTAEKRSRTYYAKWEELPFRTVSYDLGVITDGVYNPNTERVYSDDGEVEIVNVEYSGAKFLGWYDAKEDGNKITKLAYASMKKDLTLYARWELPTKKITYAGAGKDYVNDARNPASYQINPDGANTVYLYTPEKTGFIFDGWFLDKDLEHGALPHNRELNCWVMDESEDVTLYAKWIRGRWEIRYELGLADAWNGGNPETYTYGDTVKLEAPSRAGYTFDGWFTDAAFKTKATGIKADDVGEKTFYAKWTAIRYTVTYELRDERTAAFFKNENPTARGVDDEIALKPLTTENRRYKFLGWFDNVNADGDPVEKILAGTTKDVTLYAAIYEYKWGDVDFDGDVTAGDARLILRQAVGLEQLSDDALAWGDVEAPDAKRTITAADARLVLRMAVGLDSEASLKLPEYPAGK